MHEALLAMHSHHLVFLFNHKHSSYRDRLSILQLDESRSSRVLEEGVSHAIDGSIFGNSGQVVSLNRCIIIIASKCSPITE